VNVNFIEHTNIMYTQEGHQVFEKDGYHFRRAGFLALMRNLKRASHEQLREHADL
jgi:hypothetical protein